MESGLKVETSKPAHRIWSTSISEDAEERSSTPNTPAVCIHTFTLTYQRNFIIKNPLVTDHVCHCCIVGIWERDLLQVLRPLDQEP